MSMSLTNSSSQNLVCIILVFTLHLFEFLCKLIGDSVYFIHRFCVITVKGDPRKDFVQGNFFFHSFLLMQTPHPDCRRVGYLQTCTNLFCCDNQLLYYIKFLYAYQHFISWSRETALSLLDFVFTDLPRFVPVSLCYLPTGKAG